MIHANGRPLHELSKTELIAIIEGLYIELADTALRVAETYEHCREVMQVIDTPAAHAWLEQNPPLGPTTH